MSEENPWGAPPPSYPPPPHHASTPPPPLGPLGPLGPPPPRRRTGAVVASALGAVVVVAAVVTTLLVTTGGEDDGAPDAGSDTSADPTGSVSQEGPTPSSSASTPPSPPAPPTGRPADPSASPSRTPRPSADTVVGTGYSYRLPNRAWSDFTAEAQRRNPDFAIDSFIVLGSALETAQSNILVESSPAVGSPTLDELEPLWRANLSRADGVESDDDPLDVPDTTIDGERAIGVEFVDRENQNGVRIDQVAYLVQHDDKQYSIALSLPAEGDLVSRDDFDRMLATWRWDG